MWLLACSDLFSSQAITYVIANFIGYIGGSAVNGIAFFVTDFFLTGLVLAFRSHASSEGLSEGLSIDRMHTTQIFVRMHLGVATAVHGCTQLAV